MKKIFSISVIFLISVMIFSSPVFASDVFNEEPSDILNQEQENEEQEINEEQKNSEIIEEQILDLEMNLKELEEVKLLEKNYLNLVNEISIRKNALFKVIEISLNENLNIVNSIEQIDNLDQDIFNQLERMILRDNQWYQEYILKINLATSTNELKSLALDIKNHRQSEEVLSIRKLVGLIIILEELKSINTIKEKIDVLEDNIKGEDSKEILGIINYEIEETYQLIDETQMNIENISQIEDFETIREQLEKVNILLDNIYTNFSKLLNI